MHVCLVYENANHAEGQTGFGWFSLQLRVLLWYEMRSVVVNALSTGLYVLSEYESWTWLCSHVCGLPSTLVTPGTNRRRFLSNLLWEGSHFEKDPSVSKKHSDDWGRDERLTKTKRPRNEQRITTNMKETNGGSNGASATPIPEEFKLLHLYWQASNYLSVGQVSTTW